MISRRGLLVFVLGTVFVFSLVAVIALATAGVGSQSSQTGTTGSLTEVCSSSGGSCTSFSITSANLTQVSYTDELGPANYTQLGLVLKPSGSTFTSYMVFFGNTQIGTINNGLFPPGTHSVSDLTLPETVSVVPGKTYLVQVEGFFDSSSVWQYVQVTAR